MISGVFDAEAGLDLVGASSAGPKGAHIKDRVNGMIDAVVCSIVGELQWEVFASADPVLVVDGCCVDVKVDFSVG